VAYARGFRVDVFISYPVEAETWAKQFETVLKEQLRRKIRGAATYLAKRDWRPGGRSSEMLENARHAALFLAIVTRSALEEGESKRFQALEAQAFRELHPVGDRFIPIPLDFEIDARGIFRWVCE
jgi:hypothetical protein